MNVFGTIILGLALLFSEQAAAAPAVAVPASNWAESQSASMRLIAGAARDGTSLPAETLRAETLRAGIEIRLAPHFKTYWRSPGDSGVAPMVSFEGSENLASAEVLFPAPQIFRDAGGMSIGYKDHVIWPIHAKPVDPAKPVLLKLKLDYGVCEKICIPASGVAQLELPAIADAGLDQDIALAEARVPRLAKIGDAPGLAMIRVEPPEFKSGKPVFRVEIKGAAPSLLAEVKPDSWFLEVGEPQPGADGKSLFSVTIFDPQSGRNLVPCDIRLTAISGADAIEVPVRLKGCQEKP